MSNQFRCAVAALILFAAPAFADDLQMPAHVDFDSTVLHQKRGLDVYLPGEAKKNPEQRYETLYVLDGDWNAKIVAQTVDFIHSVGYLPPLIVVGVPNRFENGINSRDHDLTPSVVRGHDRSGGAAEFLTFLKTDVVPYINAHYPANGITLIHGHSYGGLFLNYVLSNDPTAFGGYIVLDPAMWWDDHKSVQTLADKLSAVPTKGIAIYEAGRSGQAWQGMALDRVQTAFEQHAPALLAWKVTQYPNESHDSLKLKSTYDALRFMFRGYAEHGVNIDTPYGLVVKGQPISLQNDPDRYDIHYTTDGSEPTRASPKMTRLMTSDDPMHLRLKSISSRGEFDQDLSLHFTFGEALAPSKSAKASEPGFFDYAYFDGSAWPHLHGKPIDKGHVKHIDMEHIDKPTFSGYVERNYTIPHDGYYLLVLSTSDKARLLVNGKTVIDLSATDKTVDRPYIVPLRAGVYPMRLEFFRKKQSDLGFEFIKFDPQEGWSGNVE